MLEKVAGGKKKKKSKKTETGEARRWGVQVCYMPEEDPEKKGNIRDDANLNQLLVLANMESYNAILIEQGKPMSERLVLLRDLAIRQMSTLTRISTEHLPMLPGTKSETEKDD